MTLTMSRPHCVYTTADEIEVACTVSGLFENDPTMTFEINDITSRVVASDHRRLADKVVARSSSYASALMGTTVTNIGGFAGATSWKPQLTQPGYYRLRVTMHARGARSWTRSVAGHGRAARAPRSGEFGWTLPAGDRPLPFAGWCNCCHKRALTG